MFRVQGGRLKGREVSVRGSGFRLKGLELGVEGLGYQVWGVGRVQERSTAYGRALSRVKDVGCGVWSLKCGVLRVSSFGFRDQGSGFRI